MERAGKYTLAVWNHGEAVLLYSSPLVPPLPGRLTIWSGSPRLALKTFFYSWAQKRGPLWAHVLLMMALNALIALLIALGAATLDEAPLMAAYLHVVPVSECIGLTIYGVHGLGEALFGVGSRRRHWPAALQFAYYTAIALGGTYLGILICGALFLWTGLKTEFTVPNQALFAALGIGFLSTQVIYRLATAQGRALEARAVLDAERARAAAAEARASVAQLQLLQAQIEPHFLFNTLANVLGMIDTRPADAKRMLEHFIRYLRSSLEVTRSDETTLGRELDLLDSYLTIFRYRMGTRLAYTIACPQRLRTAVLPPMLLQPIVENALEHGLEPKVEGGTVEIEVAEEGDAIVVSVRDTGLGFAAAGSGGVGLANVRERLQLAFGPAGRLEVRESTGHGVTVTVRFPFAEPVAA